MRLFVTAAFVTALAAVACTGGESPRDPSTPTSPAGGDPYDLTLDDVDLLVYWTELDFFGDGPVTPGAERILESIRLSHDTRYERYLLDLVSIPGPLGTRAFDILVEWKGPPGDFGPFGWIEELGASETADDDPAYLRFKQRLIAAIQPEMGAFLDPAAERLISAQEVLWGGVFVDGIPPLNDLKFTTPQEAATWMGPGDLVIGVEINGDARAYPRRIIDWHEMVNDTVGGVPVSLAYCTLCGSAILYDGRVGDDTYRFGTSGLLYRSNKLMYDTTTRTLWKQYTGDPVWGPLAGTDAQLTTLPAVHTTFAAWVEQHPESRILHFDTGFTRDYTEGSAYREYFASPHLMFPVPDRGEIEPKTIVLAVRLDGETVGYPTALLDERDFIRDAVAGREITVLATREGSGGRAYETGALEWASFDRKASTLEASDGSTWDVTEAAILGPVGQRLDRVPAHNSFWFSVLNHTPDGRLYQP